MEHRLYLFKYRKISLFYMQIIKYCVHTTKINFLFAIIVLHFHVRNRQWGKTFCSHSVSPRAIVAINERGQSRHLLLNIFQRSGKILEKTFLVWHLNQVEVNTFENICTPTMLLITFYKFWRREKNSWH